MTLKLTARVTILISEYSYSHILSVLSQPRWHILTKQQKVKVTLIVIQICMDDYPLDKPHCECTEIRL